MYSESLTAEIPETAIFYQEENGVKWYYTCDEKGRTIENYMQFEGRVLQGGWVGPRWIFQALVSMSPEERAQYSTYDEFTVAIRQVISAWNERK